MGKISSYEIFLRKETRPIRLIRLKRVKNLIIIIVIAVGICISIVTSYSNRKDVVVEVPTLELKMKLHFPDLIAEHSYVQREAKWDILNILFILFIGFACGFVGHKVGGNKGIIISIIFSIILSGIVYFLVPAGTTKIKEIERTIISR